MHDAGKKDVSASPRSSRAPAPASAGGRRLLGFPREARLVRRGDYDAVYQGGQRRTSAHFAVFFRPNGQVLSRFGSSVKRADGGAIRRNRIRRRVREIVRLHRGEIASGFDIVVHPRGSVATADFARLAEELVELLRRSLVSAEKSPE